jgi:protein TonB
MDETLLRYYPKQAKTQGIEGLAVMKVLISRNGKVTDIRLVRESYGGFGDACEKTLKSSRWKPKLDDRGRPVPVEITYTCRFEVGY